MQLVLRIKRVYFDQILMGEKTAEYRANKPYYQKLFKDRSKYKTMLLHYQDERRLSCNIKSIRLVKNRLAAAERVFVSTEHCFKITITTPRIV